MKRVERQLAGNTTTSLTQLRMFSDEQLRERVAFVELIMPSEQGNISIRRAYTQHLDAIRKVLSERRDKNKNNNCLQCNHPVDEHYDLGCIHRILNGYCKCTGAWRDEEMVAPATTSGVTRS